MYNCRLLKFLLSQWLYGIKVYMWVSYYHIKFIHVITVFEYISKSLSWKSQGMHPLAWLSHNCQTCHPIHTPPLSNYVHLYREKNYPTTEAISLKKLDTWVCSHNHIHPFFTFKVKDNYRHIVHGYIPVVVEVAMKLSRYIQVLSGWISLFGYTNIKWVFTNIPSICWSREPQVGNRCMLVIGKCRSC